MSFTHLYNKQFELRIVLIALNHILFTVDYDKYDSIHEYQSLHMYYNLFVRERKLLHNYNVFCSVQVGVSNPVDYYTFISRATVVRDTNTKIQISPLVRKISSDLKWRSLEIRQCYLQDERKLAIFKQYTEYNCRYECTLNMTISMCGCLNLESSRQYLLYIHINLQFTQTNSIYCVFHISCTYQLISFSYR